jgi:transposase-like protein
MNENRTRMCRGCGRIKPIDDFALYTARGQQGRRGKCKNCILIQKTNWRDNLPPERAKVYRENDHLRSSRLAEQRKRQRAKQAREEGQNLRGVILELNKRGLTIAQIARESGVCESTLRRWRDGLMKHRVYQSAQSRFFEYYHRRINQFTRTVERSKRGRAERFH